MKKSERNPKSEIRNPKLRLARESRNCTGFPNYRRHASAKTSPRCPWFAFGLRISGFGFLSDFGFRASDFLPLLLLALTLLLAHRLPAADASSVLNAWLSAQTNFSTWSADFIQTRSLKALNQPLISTGRIWFAKPNHFRWELGQPPQTIAVRDDELLQVIYPRLKRVERYPLAAGKSGPMGEALGLLDAGFPKSRADFEARFRLISLQATNGAWLLELQPASPSARRMMPAIRVTLATNGFVLLANELTFPDGSRMRNDFTNPVLNATIAADAFRPAVESGFTVVEPLAQ